MKFLSLAFLLFCFFNGFSQADTLKSVDTDSRNTRDTIGAFNKVEVEADFPGGIEAWKQFLYTNLRADAPYKEIPRKVKYFKQTAIVQFIVCTDGTVCNVKVINDVLPSIKKEAERVIKISGNWLPAQQDGKTVKAFRQQPITFVVVSE